MNDDRFTRTRGCRTTTRGANEPQLRQKVLSVFLTGLMVFSLVAVGVMFSPPAVSATTDEDVQFDSLTLQVDGNALNIDAEIGADDPDQIDYIFFQIQDEDGNADGGDIGGSNHNFAIIPHDSGVDDDDVDEDIDAFGEIPADDDITDFGLEEFDDFPGGQADDIAQIEFRIYTIGEDPDRILEAVTIEVSDDFDDGEEQTLDEDDALRTNDASNEAEVDTFGDWITVDEEAEVTGGPFESGAVSIDEGFDVDNDELRVDGDTGEEFDAFSYDADTGVLTIEPDGDSASSEDFQAVFRDVQYKSDGDADERAITFSLTVSDDGETDAAYYSETDRWYTWVEDDDEEISWEEARTEAEEDFDVTSHLAIIESKGENEFIRNRLDGGGWIGATAVNNDEEDRRDWFWIDGDTDGLADEEFFHQTAGHVAFTDPFPDPPAGVPGGGELSDTGDYENWNHRHEPRNMFPFFGGQDYAYFCSDDGPLSCHSGMWMDGSVDSPNFDPEGYIVEFHEEPGGEEVEVLRADTTVAYALEESAPEAEINVEVDGTSVEDDSIEVNFTDEIEFDGADSVPDGEAAIDSYQWDIDGDGLVDETSQRYSESVGDDATYLTEFGTYNVSLTVIDQNGNTDTESVTVNVVSEDDITVEIEGPYDPGTNEKLDTSDVERGQEVQFVSFVQYSPEFEEPIESFEWDFDDGTTSSENTPVHGFVDANEHTVNLTVETDTAKATDEITIDVQESERPEITEFTVEPADQELAVSFTTDEEEFSEIEVSIYRTDDLPDETDPEGDYSDALETTLEDDDFNSESDGGDFIHSATTGEREPDDYTARLETAIVDGEDGAFGQKDTAEIVEEMAPEFASATIGDPADEIEVEFVVDVVDEGDSTDAFTLREISGATETDVDDLRIEDGTVILELTDEVVAGDDYELEYDSEHENADIVSEEDGTPAESFEVATDDADGFDNDVEEIAPAFDEAEVTDADTDQLRVTFNADVNADTTDGFSLDSPDDLEIATLDSTPGDVVVLNLNRSVTADETLSVSYDGATGTVESTDDSSAAQSFDSEAVTNRVGEIEPAYVTSEITDDHDDQLRISFDTDVDSIDESGFSLDSPDDLEIASLDSATGDTVVLNLNRSVVADETLGVSYDQSSGTVVSTEDGSDGQSFTGKSVDNNVSEIVPAFEEAVVDEPADVIELNFTDDVTVNDEDEATNNLTVDVDGTALTVEEVEDGPTETTITVTITETIKSGAEVTISYDDGGDALVSSEDDSSVQGFDNEAVSNAVEAVQPEFESAVVDEPADVITVVFSADVTIDSAIDAEDALTVTETGAADPIGIAEVEQSTPESIHLTLTRDATDDDTLELEFDNSTESIVSATDDSPAANFSVNSSVEGDRFENNAGGIEAVAAASGYVVSIGSDGVAEVELRATESSPGHAEFTWENETDTIAEDAEVTTTTFTEPGTENITLTVSTASAEMSDTIQIEANDRTTPVARLDVDETVDVGESVLFDGAGSSDNVEIADYEWDFGNGTTVDGADLAAPSGKYDEPGEYTVTLTVTDTSGNEDTSVTTVHVAGPSAVLDEEDELTYGDLGINSTSTRAISVANEGTTPLDITDATIAGENASAFDLTGAIGDTPVHVRPGEERDLVAVFAPVNEGKKDATLALETNNTGPQDEWEIALTGTGVDSDIEPAAAQIEFGVTEVNDATSMDIEFVTTGASETAVDGVEITGTDAEHYDIVDEPASIGDGDSAPISVEFTPGTSGALNATLEVTTGDTISSVALSGVGEAPDIHLSPDDLTFVPIGAGDRVDTSIDVSNYGNAELEDIEVSLSGPDTDAFDVDSEPATVPAGETESLDLWFEPDDVGDHEGELVIESNDPAGESTVAVNGTAVGANIGVDQNAIDFGNTTVGETVLMNITVSNQESSMTNLSVESTDIVGQHPEDFSVERGDSPFTLEPGESRDLEINFTSIRAGEREAQLQIRSDAQNEPLINIWLTNTRSYLIVQEVGTPTTSVEGYNLEADGEHEVNVSTPGASLKNVTFDTLEMEMKRDGNFRMEIGYDDTDFGTSYPTDTGAEIVQYVELNHSDSPAPSEDTFGETAITYEVDAGSLDPGTDPEAVELYRYNETQSEWVAMSTTYETTSGDQHRYRAMTPGFSEFVVTSSAAAGGGPAGGPGGSPGSSTGGTSADETGGTSDDEAGEEDPGDDKSADDVPLDSESQSSVDAGDHSSDVSTRGEAAGDDERDSVELAGGDGSDALRGLILTPSVAMTVGGLGIFAVLGVLLLARKQGSSVGTIAVASEDDRWSRLVANVLATEIEQYDMDDALSVVILESEGPSDTTDPIAENLLDEYDDHEEIQVKNDADFTDLEVVVSVGDLTVDTPAETRVLSWPLPEVDEGDEARRVEKELQQRARAFLGK